MITDNAHETRRNFGKRRPIGLTSGLHVRHQAGLEDQTNFITYPRPITIDNSDSPCLLHEFASPLAVAALLDSRNLLRFYPIVTMIIVSTRESLRWSQQEFRCEDPATRPGDDSRCKNRRKTQRKKTSTGCHAISLRSPQLVKKVVHCSMSRLLLKIALVEAKISFVPLGYHEYKYNKYIKNVQLELQICYV